MNEPESEELKNISERVIECWTRIKAKARRQGDVTNIEKHAPCITAALNQMENFLRELNKEKVRINRFNRERDEEHADLKSELADLKAKLANSTQDPPCGLGRWG